MDRPDETLLADYRRGDERAFELLVQRHGLAIKAYALRMLRNPEQAEEVYEETFLRVATARGRWEQRGTVRGWLFTIAHRLCLDMLRRRQVRQRAIPHLVQMESYRVSPSPEALAALGQRAAQLEAALELLSETHREVVLLRLVHGLSAREAGQAMGVEEHQVHSLLSYARKRLRQELELPARRARNA